MARLSATTGVGVTVYTLVVELDDLGPVRFRGTGRICVDGVDGGEELVGSGTVPAQAGSDDGVAFGDQLGVPSGAVLVRQWHERSAGDPRGTTGVGQGHQREQALHLGLVRHQRCKDPCEPDRLGAQIDPDGAAPA